MPPRASSCRAFMAQSPSFFCHLQFRTCTRLPCVLILRHFADGKDGGRKLSRSCTLQAPCLPNPPRGLSKVFVSWDYKPPKTPSLRPKEALVSKPTRMTPLISLATLVSLGTLGSQTISVLSSFDVIPKYILCFSICVRLRCT